MAKMKKADQEMLKRLNRQIVLKNIRKHGEISRAELTQYTKLSPTTVSLITSELIDKKIVMELGIGESSGGRRPVMLGINPNARFVISIILKPKEVIYALLNLDCIVVKEWNIKQNIVGEENVKNILARCLHDIFDEYGEFEGKIVGIGISIPGIVNNQDGCILYSAPLELKEFEMIEFIKRQKNNMDCFVFKDTDALILGEHKFGIGRHYNNFAYIMVEDGVGMSYINSGNLFQPSNIGGFELGHMTIDLNGPICRCGNKGCLGTIISENYIVNSYKEKLKEKGEEGIDDELRLEDIIARSNGGDIVAKEILKEQARILGIGIANVLNMINPEMIAIGGPLSKCEWNYLDIVLDTGRNTALKFYNDGINIKFTTKGILSALAGMANYVFEKKIFSPIEF